MSDPSPESRGCVTTLLGTVIVLGALVAVAWAMILSSGDLLPDEREVAPAERAEVVAAQCRQTALRLVMRRLERDGHLVTLDEFLGALPELQPDATAQRLDFALDPKDVLAGTEAALLTPAEPNAACVLQIGHDADTALVSALGLAPFDPSRDPSAAYAEAAGRFTYRTALQRDPASIVISNAAVITTSSGTPCACLEADVEAPGGLPPACPVEACRAAAARVVPAGRLVEGEIPAGRSWRHPRPEAKAARCAIYLRGRDVFLWSNADTRERCGGPRRSSPCRLAEDGSLQCGQRNHPCWQPLARLPPGDEASFASAPEVHAQLVAHCGEEEGRVVAALAPAVTADGRWRFPHACAQGDSGSPEFIVESDRGRPVLLDGGLECDFATRLPLAVAGDVEIAPGARISADLLGFGACVVGEGAHVRGQLVCGTAHLGEHVRVDGPVVATARCRDGRCKGGEAPTVAPDCTVALHPPAAESPGLCAGAGLQVTGLVASRGNVSIGSGSRIAGRVRAHGEVSLGDATQVEGTVNARGVIALGRDVQVQRAAGSTEAFVFQWRPR